MNTVDISTLESTEEWADALTRTFTKAVREAVLEDARLGISEEEKVAG